MSRIEGYPLRQIVDLPAEHVASLFASLMALIVRLARAGLIHCDFNEFNIMVQEVRKEGLEDEYDDAENERAGVWGVGSGLKRGGQNNEENDDDHAEYQLKPGERIEKGNGFERIYMAEVKDDSEEEEEEDEEDDEEEEEDDDDDDSYEEDDDEEEFDEDGTNEGLKIELGDGSAIEPIVIDFPQMVSVEHVNAE